MNKLSFRRCRVGLLALVLVVSMLPVRVFGAEEGICIHHTAHDDSCGYAPAVEAAECTHDCQQNPDCLKGGSCSHLHQIDCYNDIGKLDCDHACVNSPDCTQPGCVHTHDDSCGYREAAEARPCRYAVEGCADCEAATRPTDPEVTEPSTKPTEPEVTEPATKPTEPEVTEPTTKPTEPEATEPTQPEKVIYKITKGDKTRWVKGSGKRVSFVTDGKTENLVSLSIDGKKVQGVYYLAEKDTVTLRNALLEKLSLGKHTITLEFANGEAAGTFTVLSAEDDNPKTGDTFPVHLMTGVLFTSLTALAGIGFVALKKKMKK